MPITDRKKPRSSCSSAIINMKLSNPFRKRRSGDVSKLAKAEISPPIIVGEPAGSNPEETEDHA
jgi:hypothetical protein